MVTRPRKTPPRPAVQAAEPELAVTVVRVPYKPRPVFIPYHRSTKRWGLTVAHRRCGKTVARINKLIRAAAVCTLREPSFAYLAPFYVQAKDIAWSYLKHYGAAILGIEVAHDVVCPYTGRKNEQELSITLPHNGAVIRLYGAENIERMRGKYFDGVVVDEGQDIAKSALTGVILPALADRKGWLDISGTPKGWANLLGEVYKMAVADPDTWHLDLLRASATGIIDEEELRTMRKLMPENEYDQEFECSFDAAITGAYYAKGVANAVFDGRIAAVPYDKSAKVHTWWDLGMSDAMSIWFVQYVGREIRVIDFYQNSGYGLEHYAEVLQQKGYLYGTHIAPHDIRVRELGTGKSRLEVAASLGVEFEIAPDVGVKDGIDAVRMAFNRMWFDKEKCEAGIEALKQYQENFDRKRGVSLGPLHNWASHPADAFRMGVVSIEYEAIVERQEARENAGLGSTEGGWMT